MLSPLIESADHGLESSWAERLSDRPSRFDSSRQGAQAPTEDQWDAAVAQVEETAGGLNVLMNIVGSNALVRVPEVDIDEFDKIFEINVTGTLRGIHPCAPLMKDSGGGSIVNIGSVAGITGNFSTGYSASKWALERGDWNVAPADSQRFSRLPRSGHSEFRAAQPRFRGAPRSAAP